MIAVITQCYLVVSVISQYIRHNKLTDNSGHLDVTKPFIAKKTTKLFHKKLYKMYKNIQKNSNIQKYKTKRMRGLRTHTRTHKKMSITKIKTC